MCTTIGFSYSEGCVFGRTLEMGVKLDHHMVYVPNGNEDFITLIGGAPCPSKYSVLGTGFFHQAPLADGINETGLMGSNNLFPGYASFAETAEEDKLNVTSAHAFGYLLSHFKNVEEVREEAKKLSIMKNGDENGDISTPMHFYFMDAEGKGIVLEPKDGRLIAHDNPYGVLTNAPEFPWHVTNLKNFLHLQPENVEEKDFNGVTLSKFGEGSGMVGLPGDFTPPSRFVRSAYFVSDTPKELDRESAILQGFRILSQADIPTGAVIDPHEGNNDETLYTAIMDTKKKAYFVKCHDNIDIQPFYMDTYKDVKEIQYIDLKKHMNL